MVDKIKYQPKIGLTKYFCVWTEQKITPKMEDETTRKWQTKIGNSQKQGRRKQEMTENRIDENTSASGLNRKSPPKRRIKPLENGRQN